MARFALIVLAFGFAAGCSVQRQWTATGGSRADGTITMAYEYGWLQTPHADDAQGALAAGQECENWGYKSAQAFPGATDSCEARDGYGNCMKHLVQKKFQCIGNPSSVGASATLASHAHK